MLREMMIYHKNHDDGDHDDENDDYHGDDDAKII